MTQISESSTGGFLRLPQMEGQLAMMFLAAVVGVAGGYGSILFQKAIQLMQLLFFQEAHELVEIIEHVPAWQVILMPVIGGLISGIIVYVWAREAKGHGVPEVMEAIALKGGVIRGRVAVVKIIASALTIGSGGSVGREGPIVQIGSGIGSTVGQIFKIRTFDRKTLVACGAAAGIAATFNAPIAGVLFALEILLGDFGLAALTPVVLSSVVATTIAQFHLGNLPSFVIPEYAIVSPYEYLIYPVLGIFSGLVALAFVKILYFSEDVFDDYIKIPEYLKPALGGLLLGVVILYFPHASGVGHHATNLVLIDQMEWKLVLALLFIKVLATSLTIGSGGSGGVFAPSLFIGAMAGGFFGWCVVQLFPGVTASPAAYALVAMGAMVAGTTHAPITAILIIFEMSNDYKIILPLMLSCIISAILTSSLQEGSIYTIKLLRRGVNLSKGMVQNLLQNLKVSKYMESYVPTIVETASIGEIMKAFMGSDRPYLYVVDGEKRLRGVIGFADMRKYLDEENVVELTTAINIADKDVPTIGPSATLDEAMQIMNRNGLSQIPVVSEDDPGLLLGKVRERDILVGYQDALQKQEIA